PLSTTSAYTPAPTPPTPVSYSAGRSVTVRSGDTMYSLSRQSGVSVEELASANNLRFPYAINIGQRLNLPGGSRATAGRTVSAKSRLTRPTSLTVAPGDTLYSLSRRYSVAVADLADANNIAKDTRLNVGQTLRVPKPGEMTARGGPILPLQGQSTLKPASKPRQLATKSGMPEKISPVAPVRTASLRNTGNTGVLPPPQKRSSSRFRWPVRGRIISNFGVGENGKRNDGINILVPKGTSVKSAENGVVAYVGSEIKGYGKLVLVRHADDWVTAYSQNSEILVARGETVQRGQIIARAGKTGSVSKPQVHFEIRKGAKAVDPLNYLVN
ncbi:MAG: LysM peptidoglycan-binding domain-containing protein, partial [Hyphomicrobiales bacterium]